MAGGNVSPQQAALFKAAGAQYRIPPQVLAGIASVETNLGANAHTSSTGAQGMMQFEPGTAQSVGVNPNDPRSAIFGAAKLLTQYGYHQNPFRAIGAYNGGPGNPQSGYATQVLSEANRLRGELAKYKDAGGQMPTGQANPQAPGGPQYAVQNTQSFDQKGYDQALKSYKLGSFLNAQGSNPLGSLGDAKGVSSGIKGLSSGGNTLFQTGLATLTAPKASDYVTAQSKLQEIAGTKLAVHPGAQAGGFGKIQLAGQAVQDAKSAGANPAAQKLLRMLHFVQGAPYSQPNHDAVNQNEFTVKARGTDCSGLISWLMGPQGLGIWRASQTTPTIPGAPGLQSGQGRVVTVWNNNQPGNSGHVFIKVGNTYFASEGGVGVHQLPASEVQGYLTQGSDGGHYQAFHPKGL